MHVRVSRTALLRLWLGSRRFRADSGRSYPVKENNNVYLCLGAPAMPGPFLRPACSSRRLPSSDDPACRSPLCRSPVLDKRPTHGSVSNGTDLPLARLLDSFRLGIVIFATGKVLIFPLGKEGDADMLGLIALVLIVLWLFGFLAFHVSASLIHLLLVVGLVLLILHFVRGGTRTA